MTQPDLFDTVAPESTAPQTPAPRCPMCGRPKRWMPRARRYGRYCDGGACSSPTLICKQCGKPYERRPGGYRYCSVKCRQEWNDSTYHRNRTQRSTGDCSHCGQPRTGLNAWDLCGDCLNKISHVARRLRAHHVPITMVSRLLDDPTCQNPGCDVDILTPITQRNGHRGSLMVVDHDHGHCPGDYSCGICVRGLLCINCNGALAYLHEDIERIKGLCAYVEGNV